MGNFSISADALRQLIEADNAPPIFDVRKPAAVADNPHTLPGARWRDYQDVAAWCGELPTGQLVVVYCVHGHEVSQGAAGDLRSLGYDAHYLRGGIENWLDAGLTVSAKGEDAT